MALLRILNGSLENQEVELSPDPMTIGRASACNIRIADSGVSSKHAKIWCENGQYLLMDLGSTNGTFVNEKDVDREQLSDGDVITFGMTKASFVGDQPRPRPGGRGEDTYAPQAARGRAEKAAEGAGRKGDVLLAGGAGARAQADGGGDRGRPPARDGDPAAPDQGARAPRRHPGSGERHGRPAAEGKGRSDPDALRARGRAADRHQVPRREGGPGTRGRERCEGAA